MSSDKPMYLEDQIEQAIKEGKPSLQFWVTVNIGLCQQLAEIKKQRSMTRLQDAIIYCCNEVVEKRKKV